MKKTLLAVCLAGASLGAASSGFAQSSTYDCTVSSLEGRGFIRDRIVFSVDPSTATGAVADDIVIARFGKAIEADVKILDNGHYRVKWDVNNLKSGANSFNLSYTLTYRPAEQRFSIRALVRGYGNRPSGRGTCAVKPGQALNT